MSLIELTGVTKSFTKGPHRITPLDDVTLRIDEGEFVALLGPSGTGKSTLLNLTAGIDRPDRGSVVVGGADLTTMSGRALTAWRAETIGYVFQQHHLVPVLTAYENVELPLFLFGLGKRDRHARVALALELVGLADRYDHLPRELSGGQEQRVAIARALVAGPSVLLADEPTGDLDHESATATLELLRRLNREQGKTVVMVTHDRDAASYGTRTLSLAKGALSEAAS